MKIVTWNVNGYRGIRKKGFEENIAKINPDILCIQETKLSLKGKRKEQVNSNENELDTGLTGYTSFWNTSHIPGYAGTAIFVKDTLEVTVNNNYNIGRIQSVVCSGICFLNIYAPAESGRLKRLQERYIWYQELIKLVRKLEQSNPICICGDFNIAKEMMDQTVDIFQKEDGEYLQDILNLGFVDAFCVEPNETNQTTWNDCRRDSKSLRCMPRLLPHF